MMKIEYRHRIMLLMPALVAGMGQVSAQVDEYLPPPTGPYQSSVVINTQERNADHEAQVYRFPPADLALPESDYYPPPTPTVRSPRERYFSEPKAEFPAPAAVEAPAIVDAPPAHGPAAALPVNPWASDQQALPVPMNNAVWGNPGAYGYQQYPYGYYNGYNPYQVAPSPWAVNPPPAYIGR